MNTDKIYAEQLANEYAPKDTSKVVALRKLDNKAKLPATIFTYTFGIITALAAGEGMCRRSCPAASGIWSASSPMSFRWLNENRPSAQWAMLTTLEMSL